MLATLPLFALLALNALAPGIPWHPSVEAALADAKARNRPVFVAVNMDRERANDELVKVHYQDERIVKLAKECASLFASAADHGSGDGKCSRCGTVTCIEHRTIEKEVRSKWLKPDATGEVVAPAHLLIGPDGKVLLSVNYSVTKGELEWCLVTALKQVDPTFKWESSGAARAPKRLTNQGVADPAELLQTAPTKQEVDDLLEQVMKGGRVWEMREQVARLMQSDDKRAITFVAGALGGRASSREEFITGMLHGIGRVSPPAYWEMVVPYVDDARIAVRTEAIVALEQLAVPKSLGALQKRWKTEKELEVKAELIRALAAVDPAGKHTIELVLSEAQKAKETRNRIAAVFAGAHFEDPKAIAQLVKTAFLADVAGVRAAAAYVVGIRREVALKPDLDAAALAEPDTGVKAAMDLATEVLNGGNASVLSKVADEYDRSPIRRERL